MQLFFNIEYIYKIYNPFHFKNYNSIYKSQIFFFTNKNKSNSPFLKYLIFFRYDRNHELFHIFLFYF